MSSTASPTAATLFATLVNHLGADVVGQLKSVLQSTATNLKASPTALTVVAQGALLQGALLASLPTLETQAIANGADTLSQLIALIPDAPTVVKA